MPTEPLTAAPADDEIARDVPCLQCGYNLRGLTSFHTCPECGLTVARSMRGDRLCVSHPRWVERLANGAGWCAWSTVCGLVCGLLANLLAWLVPLLIPLVQLTTAGLWLGGICLLTSQEPSQLHRQRATPFLASTLRITAALALLFNGMQLLLLLTPELMPIAAGGSFAKFANLVGTTCLCWWVRRLTRRLPDAQLTGRLHLMFWMYLMQFPASLVLVGIGYVAIRWAMQANMSNWVMNGSIVMAVVLALLLIAVQVCLAVLLFKCRRAFRHAAIQAASALPAPALA